MSFFRKQRNPDEDREKFLEREREFEKKKKEKLLKAQEAESTNISDNGDVTKGKTKKKGLRERIEDFKRERAAAKEERSFKKYQKEGERIKKRTEAIKARERKVFGRELTAEEAAEYAEFKAKQVDKRAEKRAKVKQELSTLGKNLSKASKTARKYSYNVGGGVGSVGFSGLGGTSILDVTPIAQKREHFEMNFGNLMAGKKVRKKKVKGPKPIGLSIFD